MVHVHSHIALLGWVYVALTTMLHYCFVKNDATAHKRHDWIFWATQGTLIGMLLTFPFQGYALFSIIFSTLFLIVSYIFFHHFIKNIDSKYKYSKSLQCIKAALWYMALSSVGPWALGVIIVTLGAQSIWYRLAIYFYLHFQYNGWMTLALIGLFFFVLEQHDIVISKKRFDRFFWVLNIGVAFTFLLSSLWTEPSTWVFVLAGFGALAQGVAFILLWTMTVPEVKKIPLTKMQCMLLKSVVVIGLVKLLLQLLTSLPYFAQIAAIHLHLTIGYLHLTFLGAISIALFFLIDYFRFFRISKRSYFLYFFGFLITEIFIFHKGLASWLQLKTFTGHTEILALASILIPLGLFLMFAENRMKS